MNKHTPAPWQVEPIEDGYTGPTYICIVGNKKDMRSKYSREICCLYTNPDGSTGNASLIAAAPDMLETLKECRDTLEGYLPDRFGALYTLVVKTITKAEGNES